jgi:DNA-binding transcriptional MerR regulator
MFKTIKELARSIGVNHWQISYAHEQGLLPEPMRIAGKRVYDEEAAQRVRQFFVDRAREKLQQMEVAMSNV